MLVHRPARPPVQRYGYRRVFIVRPPGPVHWVQLFRTITPGTPSSRWMYQDLIWRVQLGRWVLLVMPRRTALYVKR